MVTLHEQTCYFSSVATNTTHSLSGCFQFHLVLFGVHTVLSLCFELKGGSTCVACCFGLVVVKCETCGESQTFESFSHVCLSNAQLVKCCATVREGISKWNHPSSIYYVMLLWFPFPGKKWLPFSFSFINHDARELTYNLISYYDLFVWSLKMLTG